MISYIQKILFVAGPKTKAQLIWLTIAFLFLSAIDLLGISLVGPFVASINSPHFIDQFQFVRRIGGLVGAESNLALVTFVGSLIVCVFYLKGILGYLVFRGAAKTSYENQRNVRLRLLEAYQSLPLEKYVETNSARMLTSIQQNVAFFTNRALLPALKMVSEGIFLITVTVFLLITNPVLTVALGLTFSLLFVLYSFVVKERMRSAGKDMIFASNGINTTVTQSAEGFKEIRVIGAENYFMTSFSYFTRIFADASIRSVAMQFVPRYAIEATMVTFMVVVIVFGLYRSGGDSAVLLSTIGIFAFASLRSMSAVNAIMLSSNELRLARQSVWDLYDDLKRSGNVRGSAKQSDQDAACRIPMKFEQDIVAESIYYRYRSDIPYALEDVSIRIQRGQSVGIIGRSGSGKTTLVDVILGLLVPDKGRVMVDGIPIGQRLRMWMNIAAYVPQGVFLMDDTLMRNVALGRDEKSIDSKRVAQAIEFAQLKDVVDALPKGLQSPVGERGVKLSGGQRQRIALARAFYHERELIIMDEATSALDNDTERQVVDAIKSMRGKRTLIVIAHRLSTVRHCDIIYKLEGGKIVSSGTYEQVIGDGKAA